MTESNGYYQSVKTYYDHDAIHFEKRYHHNHLLKRIRESFREITTPFEFKNALEIGYGPGLDLLWLAELHPDANVYGIDISDGMYQAAKQNAIDAKRENIFPEIGSVEDIERLYQGKKFELIYVFFGALNTVDDLEKAAVEIQKFLTPGGHAVLTFVNKWYLRGFLVPFIKGRFRIAFARFRKIWGGYSPRNYLPSRCYSLSQIKSAFRGLEILKVRGYSILFPPWYDAPKWKNDRVLNMLWKTDERIGNSFAKGWGEYSLFIFRKRIE